jgi:LysM repeat protein
VKLPQFEQGGPNRLTGRAEIVDPPVETPEDPAARPPERLVANKTVTPPIAKAASPRNNTTRTPPKAETRDVPPARRAVHTVRPGETMAVLARRYGVSVKDLRAANPGLGSGVRSGQKINIPAK